MGVQYGPGYGKTQADTPGLARAGLFKPCKRLEDAGEIRIGYARSCIVDGNDDIAAHSTESLTEKELSEISQL